MLSYRPENQFQRDRREINEILLHDALADVDKIEAKTQRGEEIKARYSEYQRLARNLARSAVDTIKQLQSVT
jgi:hypothetical protein